MTLPSLVRRLILQSVGAGSIGDARRQTASDLVRDPSNPRANALLAVLSGLPLGEVASFSEALTHGSVIRGPRDQLTIDPETANTWRRAKLYAPSDASVLILGESGTGKEDIARALHENSPRKDEAFTAINCGGFTETLVETELFGHERGAFTGADKQKKGSLEATGKGTVFLDEIGELPLSVQVRLLRVLEDRTFRRVGGDGTQPLKFQGRVIAATHRNLLSQAKTGTFREDLYYRLAVLELKTRPLRERIEDAVMLANVWLAAVEPKLTLSEAAADELRAHTWPGNIRELRNVITRARCHAIAENRSWVIANDCW